MADLNSAKLKLVRAAQHLDMLSGEIEAFLSREPYRAIPEDQVKRLGELQYLLPYALSDAAKQSECIHRIYRASVVEAAPDEWGTLIGDFVHNLRSSLDHIVWQLASKPLGKGASFINEFPIYDEKVRYEREGIKKLRGVTNEAALTLIESLQPYPGRHGKWSFIQPLLMLNRLSNWDKHRVLHIVGSTLTGWGGVAPAGEEPLIVSAELGPFVDQAIIGEFIMKPDVDVKHTMSFSVAFEKEGPGRGLPVLDSLPHLLTYMRTEVIPKFEVLFE